MLSAVGEGLIGSATIITGMVSTLIRPIRISLRGRKAKIPYQCWNSQKVVMDFLNGCAAVPFAGLAATTFYPGLVPVILQNKSSIALAGFVGLIFILGEILTAGRDDS